MRIAASTSAVSSLFPTQAHLLLEKRPSLFFWFAAAGQLEAVQLLAPSVVVKDKAINFTTVLRPSSVGTVTYYWWFANKTEVSPTKPPFKWATVPSLSQSLSWVFFFPLSAFCDPGRRDSLHLQQGGKSHGHCSGLSGQQRPAGPNDRRSLWCITSVILSRLNLFVYFFYIMQKMAHSSIAWRPWCRNQAECNHYFSTSIVRLKLQCWIFASGLGLLLISAKRHPA